MNVWFNQKGALVSGGGDTRRHFQDREHGGAAATGQRLVIGADANGSNALNGGFRELIVYQSAVPMTDEECQRIAIGQSTRWATAPTVWANRYFIIGSGQSNQNGQFSAAASGDGTAGTEAAFRRFRPKLAETLGLAAERILAGSANFTMIGGMPMLKRAMPGDAAREFYFWDEDTNAPGTLWTTATSNGAGNTKAYLDAIRFLKYKRVVIVHAQGEEDAASTMDAARAQAWAQQTYAYLDFIRTYIGQPEAPIVIQPLARYAGKENVNRMRRLQRSFLAAQANVFLAPDTGHAARGTSNDWNAHFGKLGSGGFDQSTGGAEDGYQRVAWQNAKAAAHALHVVQGKDIATNDNWRGPEVVGAAKSGTSTIDVTIVYPYGSGGADFSTPSGQYGGWRVFDASDAELTVSGVTKVSASKLQLTLSVAVPAGAKVVYEPNFSSGSAEGANVRNQIVDDNAELPLPLASSAILPVG